MYEIEVRLFGIARGSDLGAAERVRKVARAARLEAYVLLAEHIHRDRETRSQWRVIDAPAGADGPLCARHGAGTSPAGRWRVAPTTLVASLPAPHGRRCAWPEAERRRIRPGWPFDLDGMWKEPVRRSPEEEGERRTVHAVLWALVPAVAVVFAAHAVPASWWFWGILAFAGFAGAARTGWWLFPDGRKTGALLVVVVSVFFTAGGLRLAGSQGWGPAGVFNTALIVGVVTGLWLFWCGNGRGASGSAGSCLSSSHCWSRRSWQRAPCSTLCTPMNWASAAAISTSRPSGSSSPR